jgi:hypothetical protein
MASSRRIEFINAAGFISGAIHSWKRRSTPTMTSSNDIAKVAWTDAGKSDNGKSGETASIVAEMATDPCQMK